MRMYPQPHWSGRSAIWLVHSSASLAPAMVVSSSIACVMFRFERRMFCGEGICSGRGYLVGRESGESLDVVTDQDAVLVGGPLEDLGVAEGTVSDVLDAQNVDVVGAAPQSQDEVGVDVLSAKNQGSLVQPGGSWRAVVVERVPGFIPGWICVPSRSCSARGGLDLGSVAQIVGKDRVDVGQGDSLGRVVNRLGVLPRLKAATRTSKRDVGARHHEAAS